MSDEGRAGAYLGAQISDRQVSELMGIARGLIADGELNDQEIEYLYKWLAANGSARSHPMLAHLIERIRDIYTDGYVDEDERSDLTDTLIRLTGSDFEVGELLKSTTLPLTQPAPNIEFEKRRFCFTGTFTFGKRSACEAAVTKMGATVGGIAWGTHYLVIGEYATASWAQSSYGRKIEHALEFIANGSPMMIVSEAHWRQYI